MKKGILLAALLLFSGFAACAGDALAEDAGPETASAFEASTITGSDMTSDVFSEAELTMIDVWATYCSACLNEMPDLAELSGEYDADTFQIIGIISDVTQESTIIDRQSAADLIAQTQADYPHLLLNDSLYTAFVSDVMYVPTAFFINADGEILETDVGTRSKEEWEEIIDALLDEVES